MARRTDVEIYMGGGNNLVLKTTKLVELRDKLELSVSGKETVFLDVVIRADFENVDEKYHTTFMQMLTARYGGVVKCYDNQSPFIDTTRKKRRWWQFWKS